MYPADTIKPAANSFRPEGAPEPAFHSNYELRSYGTVPANGEIPDDMGLNLIRGYRACVSYHGRATRPRARGAGPSWVGREYHRHFLGRPRLSPWREWRLDEDDELRAWHTRAAHRPHAGQKTAGQRTKAFVELVDMYPTLAQLCGLPLPPHLEGASFAPLLEKPDLPWKKAAFSQYLRPPSPGKPPYMGRSVRTDRWRYTEWTDTKKTRAPASSFTMSRRIPRKTKTS